MKPRLESLRVDYLTFEGSGYFEKKFLQAYL